MTRRATQSRRRRGTILIVAMLVVFALASMALVLGRAMRVEATISANQLAAAQASAAARAGEQLALAVLSEGLDSLDDVDEGEFERVQVGQGYFWIVRPDYGDTSLPAFGLVDESSKLDLNAAWLTEDILLRTPGVQGELPAAIIDWRTPEDGGTGGSYASLERAYQVKNDAFETVEELMLVKGVTRRLLYGQGSTLPLGESGSTRSRGRSLGGDRYVQRGLFDLFTVWSVQPVAAAGEERINVNAQQQRQQLRQLLVDTFGNDRGSQIGALIPPRARFDDVFDFALDVQMTQAEFEQIEARLSAQAGAAATRGKVNINQAPREVLMCVGDLDTGDVETLLARRESAAAAKPGSIAWVFDALQEKSRGLGNQITGRGGQYSADIVACSADGRAFKRVRVVIDASGTTGPSNPNGDLRVIYRRDLTDGGWPLDPSILESLRAGGSADETSGRSRNL